MKLGELPAGVDGRVVDVQLDAGLRLRLGEMGLRNGALLQVTQNAAFGGRVVAVGADRFAVDGHTCAQIRVEPQSAVPPQTRRTAS
jgi:ferrous iron transport protein A